MNRVSNDDTLRDKVHGSWFGLEHWRMVQQTFLICGAILFVRRSSITHYALRITHYALRILPAVSRET